MRFRSGAMSLWASSLSLIFAVGCGLDHEGGPEPSSDGGSASSGANGGVGAGGSGSGGSSGEASGGSSGEASGGSGGDAPAFPAPEITSFSPEKGAYGDRVVIEGKGLGSKARDNVFLTVGDVDPIELFPDSEPEVISWNEQRIEFRFPFPASGKVTLHTPQGTVEAGSFEPVWTIGTKMLNAPTTALLSSVSTGEGAIAALFDGKPPRLIELGPEGVTEHQIDLGEAQLSTVELYLESDGALAGFGLSKGDGAEIIALENLGGDLVATPTGILLDLEDGEVATAGGPDGAVVWMRRSDGWWRARPLDGTWTVDKGPVADPKPNEPMHASGATSDGSLYIGYGVDTSFLFDDTETPYLVKLGPSANTFSTPMVAGGMTDDYLTSLSFKGRGRGLVVSYCGSDVDPWALSGTELQCFTALRPQNGSTFERAPKEGKKARHGFSATEAVMSVCEDSALSLRSDTLSDTDPGESLVFTCREPLALEIDSADRPVPLLREGSILYLMAPRLE
jgi:hypothetical protein